MIYKQKEQHHIYQISPTNEHTAEMQLPEVGFTWTKAPECNTEAEEKRTSCKMKQMKQRSSNPTSPILL